MDMFWRILSIRCFCIIFSFSTTNLINTMKVIIVYLPIKIVSFSVTFNVRACTHFTPTRGLGYTFEHFNTLTPSMHCVKLSCFARSLLTPSRIIYELGTSYKQLFGRGLVIPSYSVYFFFNMLRLAKSVTYNTISSNEKWTLNC